MAVLVVLSWTEQNNCLAYNGAPEVTANYPRRWLEFRWTGCKWKSSYRTINAQTFWTTASGGRYGSAEFFTYDATNFRVRELSLGYSIPLPVSFLIKSARLSLVARNLFFFTGEAPELDIPGLGKRKMAFDPDMALGNGNWQGISYGTLPSTAASVLTCSLHSKKKSIQNNEKI